jgi:5,6,7,8-tetrahydromethanopterin hydro-lyase
LPLNDLRLDDPNYPHNLIGLTSEKICCEESNQERIQAGWQESSFAKGRQEERAEVAHHLEAEAPWSAAEPEVIIGQLNGPVGYAIAQMIGNQVQGHSKVFAILNCDVQIRPVTVMVSKVTVKDNKYTNILMGTVQAAIAHGVLDAVRAGHLPKELVNELGIIVSVWLDPSIVKATYDPEVLFATNREATTKAIAKAMNDEPNIDWLLANQDSVPHFFHQMALDGKL